MSATQTLESQWDRDPLTVDQLIPTSMLRFHLGRVHVGTSDLEVARDVWRAMAKRPNDYTRPVRRETLAAALWIHHEHRAEYMGVMSGAL
jgi:hypothetical protein